MADNVRVTKILNQRMLRLTMDLLVEEALEDDFTILTRVIQDEPDTVSLRFSFGKITLFDDGTWKLEE